MYVKVFLFSVMIIIKYVFEQRLDQLATVDVQERRLYSIIKAPLQLEVDLPRGGF